MMQSKGTIYKNDSLCFWCVEENVVEYMSPVWMRKKGRRDTHNIPKGKLNIFRP